MSLPMNQNDTQIMQSYPDPTDNGSANGGPFYSPNNNNNSNNSNNTTHQRLTNSDELQLAAQLSRGLEPMMMGGSNGGESNDAADNSAQNHANHQYAPEQHLHHQLDQPAMAEPQYAIEENNTAPRKRSKVSRACDECRRKKIRCDATSESVEEQCSNCRRVSARCSFSRIPMKRGPSKGYIKELADRLHTLEGAMQQAGEIPQFTGMHHDGTPRRASNDFTPPPPSSEGNQARKRTFSTISNEFGTPYQQPRSTASWSSTDPQRHAPPVAGFSNQAQLSPDQNQTSYRSNYSPIGLAPQPTWRNVPEMGRRSSVPIDDFADRVHPEQKLEWDDTLIDGYYKHIQPTFPMLPYTHARLGSLLGGCPSNVREAFIEALYAAVKSFQMSNAPPYQEFLSTRRAASLVEAAQLENPANSTLSSNLVQLQTLILLAIEAENHGPAGARGSSVWLGRAIALAHSMKLYSHRLIDDGSDADSDSEDIMARRTWLCLVMLDAYRASSTPSPVMIPATSVVLLPEDQQMLGDSTYTLIRLSSILGHVSAVLAAPADLVAASSSAAPIIGTLLVGQLERFRETFPASVTPESSPLVHLAYWHVCLLMKRATPCSDPKELLTPANNIAMLLLDNPTLTSPLIHHFKALATLTLLDLLDVDSTHDEAEAAISKINESYAAKSAWNLVLRDTIQLKQRNIGHAASVATAASQHALTASQGLQHLADLATATEADRTEALNEARPETVTGPGSSIDARNRGSWDSTALTRNGYLSTLVANASRI